MKTDSKPLGITRTRMTPLSANLARMYWVKHRLDDTANVRRLQEVHGINMGRSTVSDLRRMWDKRVWPEQTNCSWQELRQLYDAGSIDFEGTTGDVVWKTQPEATSDLAQMVQAMVPQTHTLQEHTAPVLSAPDDIRVYHAQVDQMIQQAKKYDGILIFSFQDMEVLFAIPAKHIYRSWKNNRLEFNDGGLFASGENFSPELLKQNRLETFETTVETDAGLRSKRWFTIPGCMRLAIYLRGGRAKEGHDYLIKLVHEDLAKQSVSALGEVQLRLSEFMRTANEVLKAQEAQHLKITHSVQTLTGEVSALDARLNALDERIGQLVQSPPSPPVQSQEITLKTHMDCISKLNDERKKLDSYAKEVGITLALQELGWFEIPSRDNAGMHARYDEMLKLYMHSINKAIKTMVTAFHNTTSWGRALYGEEDYKMAYAYLNKLVRDKGLQLPERHWDIPYIPDLGRSRRQSKTQDANGGIIDLFVASAVSDIPPF